MQEAIVCQVDADFDVPGSLLFKIPACAAAFLFLVFKIPVGDTSFMELSDVGLGLGPNVTHPAIVKLAQRVLFKANHNLVAG